MPKALIVINESVFVLMRDVYFYTSNPCACIDLIMSKLREYIRSITFADKADLF